MKFRDFHPTVRLRLFIQFFSGLLSNMVFPFMAIYFAKKLGTTVAGVSTILSIGIGGVFGMLGGYLADRFGRKRLILASGVGIMLSYLMMALFNSPWSESPWVTFFMVLAVTSLWCIMGPATDAMLLDVTTPEARKYVYGIMYWVTNLSMAVSGIVGALLFEHYMFQLCLVLAVAEIAFFLITWRFIDDTYRPPAASGSNGLSGVGEPAAGIWSSYREVFRDSTFVLFVIGSILCLSVEFHMGNYIGVRLEREMKDAVLFSFGGWTYRVDGIEMLGLLRTENTLLVVLLSLVVREVINRFSDRFVLFVGLAVYVAFYSYLTYSNSPSLLMLAMLFATFGELMFVPIKQAYLGNMAPEHARSSYMAVYNFTYRGAMLIGGGGVILGGWLPTWSMALLVLGTGAAGVLLIAWIVARLEERRNVVEPSTVEPNTAMTVEG